MASAALGCATPGEDRSGQTSDEVIYGEDTRRDVYAESDAALRGLTLASSVAFVSAEHLVGDAGGNFVIASETLGDANQLCPGEAFTSQPAAATCSGILVDDQLVLTAGHCVNQDATCDDRLVVFDYAITDPARALAIGGDAVHRCKSIPLRGYGLDPGGRRRDYAFVELDRPVGPARRPVPLGPGDPAPGSALAVIGYPSGLPVKIDAGAQLLWMRPCRDYFTLSSDTFRSSSGSGVFDPAGRLVGIFVRGSADYAYVPERGCAVARRIETVADPAGAEQAGSVALAIDALCASGWPSARLCSSAGGRAQAAPEPAAGSCPTGPVEPPTEAGGCAISSPSDRSRSPAGAIGAAMVAILVVRWRRAASVR